MTLVSQSVCLITRPGMDVVMSPKSVGSELRRYLDDGSILVIFGMHHYRACPLDYYFGQDLTEAATEVGFLRLLNRHPKVVMMTTGWFWGQWTNRPYSLQVMRTQTMARGSWVIAVQDKPPPEP